MQRIDLTGTLSFSRLVYGMWRLALTMNKYQTAIFIELT